MRYVLWVLLLPCAGLAQNSHVLWFCPGAGGGRVATSTEVIICTVGQSFVNTAAAAGSRVVSGFLADGRLVGPVTGVGEEPSLPGGYALAQNYPNPFNPHTLIGFEIPAGPRQTVSLRVYDLLGREVAVLVDGAREPGTYTVPFDATGRATGPYFYRLSAGSFHAIRKMMVLK